MCLEMAADYGSIVSGMLRSQRQYSGIVAFSRCPMSPVRTDPYPTATAPRMKSTQADQRSESIFADQQRTNIRLWKHMRIQQERFCQSSACLRTRQLVR